MTMHLVNWSYSVDAPAIYDTHGYAVRVMPHVARVNLEAVVSYDRVEETRRALEGAEAPDHELVIAAVRGDKAKRVHELLARCDHEDCWSCPAHTSQLGRDDCLDCANHRELGKACPERPR